MLHKNGNGQLRTEGLVDIEILPTRKLRHLRNTPFMPQIWARNGGTYGKHIFKPLQIFLNFQKHFINDLLRFLARTNDKIIRCMHFSGNVEDGSGKARACQLNTDDTQVIAFERQHNSAASTAAFFNTDFLNDA